VTIGKEVFIRVVETLPVAVPLDVIVAATDPDAVAVTVLELVVVFASLFVGVCDAVLVPDLIIENAEEGLSVTDAVTEAIFADVLDADTTASLLCFVWPSR
jgi:hypothetical protein